MKKQKQMYEKLISDIRLNDSIEKQRNFAIFNSLTIENIHKKIHIPILIIIRAFK